MSQADVLIKFPTSETSIVTVEDLKAAVGREREVLKTKSGICAFSENGPIGMVVIDALVETIESLQKQIDELRNVPLGRQ